MKEKKVNFAKKINNLDKELLNIIKLISQEAQVLKFKVYLVGGIVRDLLLNKKIFDLDIVVEGNAYFLALKVNEFLKGKIKKHHAFGTATIYLSKHRIDFATSRKEIYPTPGALPVVSFSSLSDDLFRRDFTINAMAISLNQENYGTLIDFYGGLKDLGRKILRILHDKSFLDDPTRILRIIRFEQRFNFKIEKKTFLLLKKAIKENLLNLVNPHRLRDEIILICEEEKPLKIIKRINSLFGFTFLDDEIKLNKKSFLLGRRIEKCILSFKEKKFFRHFQIKAWIIYLGLLVFKLSLYKVKYFLHKFAFHKREREIIISIVKNIERIKRLNYPLKPHSIFILLSPLRIEAILFFYAYYPFKKLRENIIFFLENLIHIKLEINGEDLKKLNIKPSPFFGKILKKVFYTKLDGKIKTKEEEIKIALKFFHNN